MFDTCPLDFAYVDINHVAPDFFFDINNGLNPHSAEVSPTSGLITSWRPIWPTMPRPLQPDYAERVS